MCVCVYHFGSWYLFLFNTEISQLCGFGGISLWYLPWLINWWFVFTFATLVTKRNTLSWEYVMMSSCLILGINIGLFCLLILTYKIYTVICKLTDMYITHFFPLWSVSKLQILEFPRKFHVAHSIKITEEKESNLCFPGGKTEPQQEFTTFPWPCETF